MQVSIIIPIFNCAKYLNQCFEGLTAQTLEDFEVILVNDGSTDNSEELCLEIAKKDSRFSLISKEKSEGAGPARNSGIDASKGDFLMFLDSDDRIAPNMLERMVSAITKEKTDVVICGYETYIEGAGEANNEKFAYSPRVIQGKEGVRELFANEFPEGLVGYLWNKIYSASVIKENGLRFPPMRRLQDGVFNINFFNVAESLAIIEDILYFYRINAQSDMFRKCPPDYFELIKEFTVTFMETKKRWGDYSDEKINVFFLNETGTCIENTFSPQWGMTASKRREYYIFLSNDDLLKQALGSGAPIGRYRHYLISFVLGRHYFLVKCVVKTKVFLKTALGKVFYFLKRIGKNA